MKERRRSPQHRRRHPARAISVVLVVIAAICVAIAIKDRTHGPTSSPNSATTGQPADATALPTGDLPGWHQILATDFNHDVALGSFPGPAYSRFFAYNGIKDTSGHGIYSPAKVLSVHNGVLDWYVHTENGTPLVSAVVPTVPGTNWGQTYGRYSIRFRSDSMPGYKLAFLLWPDDNDWLHGEVDFPETTDLTPNNTLYANRYGANRPVANAGGAGFRTTTTSVGSRWHIATTEWTPSGLSYYLDGRKLGTTTSGVPTVRMHWVLQVETAIGGQTAPAANVSGHVQVDWVAMYSRTTKSG